MHRRTAPRVVGGRVLRKNNWKRHHGDYIAVSQAEIRTVEPMGWHRPGVVAICPWERELWWTDADPRFVEEHVPVLERLEVERRKAGGRIELRWTETQARAFQLLDVLPHELGHHHDRMTTRSRRVARGEGYAEAYARRVMDEVWDAYVAEFGL